MWGKAPVDCESIRKKRTAESLVERVALARRRLGDSSTRQAHEKSLEVRRAVATAQAAQATKGGQRYSVSTELWFESFRQTDAFEDFDIQTLEEWTGNVDDAALDAVNGLPKLPQLPLKVCSLQVPGDGSRRFVSASVPELWRRTVQLAPASRHFYEILREDTPLHLYFDIEFNKSTNPNLNGDPLVSLLLQWVASHLKDCFGPIGSFDARHVIDLDSTTPTKFSRHVIIRLPSGAVFRSVQHVGAFVLSLVRRLQRWRELDDEVAALWVAPPPPPKDLSGNTASGANAPPNHGTQSSSAAPPSASAHPPAHPSADQSPVHGQPPRRDFVADLAVYTKNRAMRQYLSTKPGRNAPLLPTKSDPLKLQLEAAEGGGAEVPPLTDWWLRAPHVSPTFVHPLTKHDEKHAPRCTGNNLLVGSTQWERALWRYCFISDLRPPLFLARGFYQGRGLLHDSMTGLDPPCCPVSGAPLLYMSPPAHPFCTCDARPSQATAGHDVAAGKNPAQQPKPQNSCTHFTVCAAAWRVRDAPRGAAGASGVLGASRNIHASTWTAAPQYPSSVLVAGTCGSSTSRVGLRAEGGAGLQQRQGSGAGSFPCPELLQSVCAYAESVCPTAATVRSWSVLERDVVFERAGAASGSGASSNSAAPQQCRRRVIERATLNMQGNRYCRRIGRAHRSNNVNFTMDFAARVVWQTCMDWECRQARYRSGPLPIPADAFPDQTPGPQYVLLPSTANHDQH